MAEKFKDPFEKDIQETDDNPEDGYQKYACTIINLMPMDIHEEKPHLLPASFNIPAAEGSTFGILYVEEAIHYVPNPLIDEGQPGSAIKQVTMPDAMAKSIVDDWVSAQLALGESASPGLFWLRTRLTRDQIKRQHSKTIAKYGEFQNRWFHNLVALADADWNKNHNMLAVSDLQRLAAKALGINKEWVEMRQQENTACPFCTILVPVGAIKCPNCKEIVDVKRYKELTSAI